MDAPRKPKPKHPPLEPRPTGEISAIFTANACRPGGGVASSRSIAASAAAASW